MSAAKILFFYILQWNRYFIKVLCLVKTCERSFVNNQVLVNWIIIFKIVIIYYLNNSEIKNKSIFLSWQGCSLLLFHIVCRIIYFLTVVQVQIRLSNKKICLNVNKFSNNLEQFFKSQISNRIELFRIEIIILMSPPLLGKKMNRVISFEMFLFPEKVSHSILLDHLRKLWLSVPLFFFTIFIIKFSAQNNFQNTK